MPAPSAGMMSQLARQTFERLRRESRPGGVAGAAAGAANAPRGVKPLDLPTYIDGICSAICSAWDSWQRSASMLGVRINAVSAMGGSVVGPPFGALILAAGPKTSPEALKLTMTIGNSLGAGWLQFTSSISVPGLPWYPAFAAMPAPVAPPLPNVPCPLVALTMSRAQLGATMLKTTMAAQSSVPDHQALFGAIAEAFSKVLDLWLASTLVTNVLGTGPVPSFAPPYVPVGPVIGGVGNMPPGGFL